MTTPLAVPALASGAVALRPHTMADLDAVFERCLDPDTRRWTTIPLEYTRDDAAEYLSGLLDPSEHQISWAIEVAGRYAGTIDLRSYGCAEGHGAGDLGFVTHPSARGRGVMSQAVVLATAHALDDLGWELVQWKANVGNVASYKTAWRAGYPVPAFVPALLQHRGVMVDGWISTLRRGEERAPTVAWEEAEAQLLGHVRIAVRAG
jgi:RimJ/RimL family protein N-acetyltransferase